MNGATPEPTAQDPPVPLDCASDLLNRLGIMPLRVPYKEKNPGRNGWESERLKADELSRHFNGRPMNIGGLWGDPSGGAVDIDLDCPEAKVCARWLLPPTEAIYGHAGNPASHRIYRCLDGTTPEKTQRYKDPIRHTSPDGKTTQATLIELRSTGGHTLTPGSTHPDGHVYQWEAKGQPATVDGELLAKAVARTAAAALLAKYWAGTGSRHDAALALGGGLARLDWNVKQIEVFARAVLTAATGETELRDRLQAIVDSVQRQRSGRTTTGWRSLAGIMPAEVVSRVREWLGAPVDSVTTSHETVTGADGAENEPPHLGGMPETANSRNSRMSHGGHVFADDELAEGFASVPLLPAWASLSPDEEASGFEVRRAWLDPFVDDLAAMAPMTPKAQHEAAGLFALATTIARRVCVTAGAKRLYPTFAGLSVAPTTLYTKTTGMEMLAQGLEKAEVGNRLMPPRFTEAALLADLALRVPQDVREGDELLQAAWLAAHAFGAQRSILLDEADAILTDTGQEFNAGLLQTLLRLADAPDRMTPSMTVGRGVVSPVNVGVSFFGATTPAALQEHASKKKLWGNGFFARYVFIVPNEAPRFAFWGATATGYTASVLAGLEAIDGVLPTPKAAFTHAPGGAAKDLKAPTEAPRIIGAKQEGYGTIQAAVDKSAWQAWERYAKAMWALAADDLPDRLCGPYGRMATHAMKAALSLSVQEWAATPEAERPAFPTVRLGHWAAAQAMAERWRANVHQVVSAALRSERSEVTASVAGRLCRWLADQDGPVTRRDAERGLRWSAEQLTAAVKAAAGRVVEEKEEREGPGQRKMLLTLRKPRDCFDCLTKSPEGGSSQVGDAAEYPDDGVTESVTDCDGIPANDGFDVIAPPAQVATGRKTVAVDATRLQELLDAHVPRAEALDRASVGEGVVTVPEVSRPSNGPMPAGAAVAVLERPDPDDDDAEYF